MNRDPAKIIADIIKNELALTDNQVFIYNNNFRIPNVDDLFVVVSLTNIAPYSQGVKYNNEEPFLEKTWAVQKEDYNIDILSRDNSARLRLSEVSQALSSTRSIQKQEEYDFKIFNVKGINNTSNAEGDGILTRFTINFSVFARYTKEKEVDYFEHFSESIIND
jgi:hypothetical protein